jgi:hypothetical protein
VNQVYPEFAGQVTLVDVNVYDQDNQTLIYREEVNFIPTLVFYDHMRERQLFVGVMSEPDLRQKLSEISREPEE